MFVVGFCCCLGVCLFDIVLDDLFWLVLAWLLVWVCVLLLIRLLVFGYRLLLLSNMFLLLRFVVYLVLCLRLVGLRAMCGFDLVRCFLFNCIVLLVMVCVYVFAYYIFLWLRSSVLVLCLDALGCVYFWVSIQL